MEGYLYLLAVIWKYTRNKLADLPTGLVTMEANKPTGDIMRIEERKQVQQARLEEARAVATQARGAVLRLVAATELDLACEKIDFLTIDTDWAAGQLKITSAVLVFGDRVMSDIVVDSATFEVISSRPWVVE